jgi:L-fucose isomerase-like protein
MDDTKLKAAVVLVSHTREPSNFSMSLLKNGVTLLKKENIDILFNHRPLTTDGEIREEIIKLKRNDPDVYIIVPGNWIEPPVVCHPLEEIRHENILLWGFPESLELISEGHFLGSASAFSVLRNGMSQMGFKFKAVLGFPDDPDIIKELIDFISAGHVSQLMKKVKLGLIGYLSMGIYTTCFDQQKIRKVFGTEIDCSSDSYILYKKMQGLDKAKVTEVENELKSRCAVDEKVIKNGSLEKSAMMYIALKNMIEEGGWKGLTVKCQHEFSTYLKCTACLPLSMLTDEGIMCTDEGDVHALITMIIMKYLSKQDSPIYFGDIYKLREGGFLMGHCGLSPHSCADNEKKVSLLPQNPRISKDGKTTGGVISHYNFKEGPVTIGRIENDRNGNYIFHFCRGDVKPAGSMLEGISTLIFTPERKDDTFEENQLANHYIFIYEDLISRIEEFCKINELRIVKQEKIVKEDDFGC